MKTNTMYKETTLFHYITSKIICLFIGHLFNGFADDFVFDCTKLYCDRCYDTRTFVESGN